MRYWIWERFFALADYGRRMLIECCSGSGMGKQTLYRGWEGAFRVPAIIGGLFSYILKYLLLYILMERLVKIAVQLWSQIWPTDNRELDAKLGKPWEIIADGGRLGRGRLVVYLDVMIWPLGKVTLTNGFDLEVAFWGRWWDYSWKFSDAPLSTLISKKFGADIDLHNKLSLCLAALEILCCSIYLFISCATCIMKFSH